MLPASGGEKLPVAKLMPSLVRRAAHYVLDRVLHPRMDAARAYDSWSATYDKEPENLLLYLDEQLMKSLLSSVPLEGKVVVDVGCGTGRHWPRLLEGRPSRLVGYDASQGMLARLRQNLPQAEAHVVSDHRLSNLPAGSVDVLISTLTLGYLADLDAAVGEWSRALRGGGELILTDLHPDVAATGTRGFRAQGRAIQIRHHLHTLASLRASATAHHLMPVRFEERIVDDSMRAFYEARGATGLFLRLEGSPMIYGMQLRKAQHGV